MAEEDQRAAREADVAGEIAEKLNLENNDSRYEQMDSCICSKGICSLEAPWRANEVRATAGALSRGSELVEPQHEFLDLG